MYLEFVSAESVDAYYLLMLEVYFGDITGLLDYEGGKEPNLYGRERTKWRSLYQTLGLLQVGSIVFLFLIFTKLQ